MEVNELLRIALARGASDLHFVVPNPPVLRINGRLTILDNYPSVTPEITASVFQSISSRTQQQTFEQELDFSMEISSLLRIALAQGASDLHFVVPNPPVLRINGRLTTLDAWPRVTPEITSEIFHSVTSKIQQQMFEQEQELDFSLEMPELSRFRVNVSLQRGSVSLAFRLVPLKVPTMKELGLPEICKKLALLPRGLVLVTGPTGSGKSSTLAAMLNYLNENERKKVVTIEDPIEYVFPTGRCIISQRQLGSDTRSFGVAVERSLRQDPNVIMIGEMRDLATMSSALTAAETGHLVLSTLHTRGAAQSVSRIVDVFPAAQQQLIRIQLANVIEGVISQALLRRANGKGRVAAFEVMLGTTAIRNLIREDKLNQIPIFMESRPEDGMRLLHKDLERFVSDGTITVEEALTLTTGTKEAEAFTKKAEESMQTLRERVNKALREMV
jgi:twitching motility protein PilT